MNSILKTEVDVHAKHPSDNEHANHETLINKAGAESLVPQMNGATNTNFKEGQAIFAKELKELLSFRDLLEADRHKVQHSGRYVKCCCPFHPDSTPSFFVNEDDSHGKCYGCDWYGDIFKYEMDFHHVDFRTAWARLNDYFYKCPRAGRKAKATTQNNKPAQVELSHGQKAERKKYAERLATDSWIANRICEKRKGSGEKWRPETLQALGSEGSLGWAGDALAFIYPSGTKYRNWPHKGEADIWWDCAGLSLWRQHRLEGSTHVYLTESETDAITLIDIGIENKPGTAVIAAPSATSFLPKWAELFKGKAVTLCFDNDLAGEIGMDRVGPLLQPYASKVLVLDLGRAV